MTDTFHIVAGNYEEFRQYRNKKYIEWISTPRVNGSDSPPKYTFVQHIYQLRGLTNIKGFFIGTYDKRDDIDEIKQQIINIKSRPPFYHVYLNGVVVSPKDYFISETFGILNGNYHLKYRVVLSFFQAPPAGAHLVIENKDGIVISRTVPDNPNSAMYSFSYEFPEAKP